MDYFVKKSKIFFFIIKLLGFFTSNLHNLFKFLYKKYCNSYRHNLRDVGSTKLFVMYKWPSKHEHDF